MIRLKKNLISASKLINKELNRYYNGLITIEKDDTVMARTMNDLKNALDDIDTLIELIEHSTKHGDYRPSVMSKLFDQIGVTLQDSRSILKKVIANIAIDDDIPDNALVHYRKVTGESVASIAEKLEVSVPLIYKYLKEADISPRLVAKMVDLNMIGVNQTLLTDVMQLKVQYSLTSKKLALLFSVNENMLNTWFTLKGVPDHRVMSVKQILEKVSDDPHILDDLTSD